MLMKLSGKKIRNKTSEIIKKAEVLYFRKLLTEHNNISKAPWSTFGKVLNSKKIKHKYCYS